MAVRHNIQNEKDADLGEEKAGNKLDSIEDQVEAIQAKRGVPAAPFEPRCRVCTSPYRRFIDGMLAQTGASYQSIAERIPGPDGSKLDRRSVANHAKKHLGFVDDAIRKILEDEASAEGQDYEEHVKGAITHRGVLQIIVRKAYNDIVSGEAEVEVKDLLSAIQALQQMDEKTNATQVDFMRAQTSAFIQAIREETEPDQWERITTRMKAIMARDGYFEAPIQEAQVVDIPALPSS